MSVLLRKNPVRQVVCLTGFIVYNLIRDHLMKNILSSAVLFSLALLPAAEPAVLGIPAAPVPVQEMQMVDRTAQENNSGPYHHTLYLNNRHYTVVVFRTEYPMMADLAYREAGSSAPEKISKSSRKAPSYDHGQTLLDVEPGKKYICRILRHAGSKRVQEGESFTIQIPAALPEKFPVANGPWLFNADTSSISVGWRSAVPLAGGIEFRKKGETQYQERFAAVNGQLQPRRRAQIVDLTGLEPGTEYEYRLIALDLSSGAKVIGPAGTFRTFSAKAPACRAVVFADSHSNFRWVEKALRFADAGKNADFIVFNGDSVWDGIYLPDGELLMTDIVDPCRRAGAGSVPLVPVRGNHEYDGAYAADWSKYFRSRQGKTYYSFTQGPCHFTVLDSGPLYNLALNRCVDEYFQEQQQWLEREVLPSEAFRKAVYRIVIIHMATHGQGGKENKYRSRVDQYFGKLLNSDQPGKRIHLMLGGHTHSYRRMAAHAKQIKEEVTPVPLSKRAPEGGDRNYCVVTGSGPNSGLMEYSALLLNATAEKLTITAFDQNCRVFDSFSLFPDRKALKTSGK